MTKVFAELKKGEVDGSEMMMKKSDGCEVKKRIDREEVAANV